MPTLLDLLWEQGDRCHYCKLTTDRNLPEAHPRRATVEHKTPLGRGGTWRPENLVLACRRCNHEKGNLPYEVYLWFRHMRLLGEQECDLREAIALVLGEPQPVARKARQKTVVKDPAACPACGHMLASKRERAAHMRHMHAPPYQGVLLNPWWARP